jgi:hypothetical protein
MSEEPPAIAYGRFIHWLRAFIQNEVRAERRKHQEGIVRICPPPAYAARPLYHLSDEDGGWLMDQTS